GDQAAKVPAGGELLLSWGDPQPGTDSTELPAHSLAVVRG
ncbi:MAG: hypothetical protein K0R68_2916, partial [Mycobacterium sp.]|nr:hypothetical protein [Mycobacterium sp.]